jgi:hypothetical protein
MLKNIFLICTLLILTVSGCQTSAGTIQALLDKEFSLAVGQTAELKDAGFTVQFETVQEDSRCPKDATCIWAGRVRSTIQVSENGQKSQVVLSEPGDSAQAINGTYKEYQFISRTLPYPELGKAIIKGNYHLFLTVKKIS